MIPSNSWVNFQCFCKMDDSEAGLLTRENVAPTPHGSSRKKKRNVENWKKTTDKNKRYVCCFIITSVFLPGGKRNITSKFFMYMQARTFAVMNMKPQRYFCVPYLHSILIY